MTPKTLDKYIAALKKKAAAEGWSEAEYKKELNNYYFDFADQYNAGKITFAEMAAVQKKINNAEKNMVLQGKKAQAAVSAAPAVNTGMHSSSVIIDTTAASNTFVIKKLNGSVPSNRFPIRMSF